MSSPVRVSPCRPGGHKLSPQNPLCPPGHLQQDHPKTPPLCPTFNRGPRGDADTRVVVREFKIQSEQENRACGVAGWGGPGSAGVSEGHGEETGHTVAAWVGAGPRADRVGRPSRAARAWAATATATWLHELCLEASRGHGVLAKLLRPQHLAPPTCLSGPSSPGTGPGTPGPFQPRARTHLVSPRGGVRPRQGCGGSEGTAVRGVCRNAAGGK